MPQTKFQRFIFALITVVITVHAYVFYSLYVENGAFFSSIEGATGVLDGIRLNGGVMMFGKLFPIWSVVLRSSCWQSPWRWPSEVLFLSNWPARSLT